MARFNPACLRESALVLVTDGKSCVCGTSSSPPWENRIGRALFHDTKTTIVTSYELCFMVALATRVHTVQHASERQGSKVIKYLYFFTILKYSFTYLYFTYNVLSTFTPSILSTSLHFCYIFMNTVSPKRHLDLHIIMDCVVAISEV